MTEDCTYDSADQNAWLRGLDFLTAADAFRYVRQIEENRKGYRRYTYKYRPFVPEHLRQVFIDSKLWLSAPASFNDPFEMRPYVVFEGSVQEKRKSFDERLKRVRPDLAYSKRQTMVNDLMGRQDAFMKNAGQVVLSHSQITGVCSFADDPTSIVMWGHYASNHAGVCIQLEIAGSPSRLFAAIPVHYSDEYPVFNWAKPSEDQLEEMILRKSNHWSYERERRIVCPGCANKTYWFDPKACSSVIVGCSAAPDVTAFLVECNTERRSRGMPVFRIYQAHRHHRKYKLIFHRVCP
jgi:hypothetical protein